MAAGRRGRRLLARAAGTGRRRARPGRPRRGFDSARASARPARPADLRRPRPLDGDRHPGTGGGARAARAQRGTRRRGRGPAGGGRRRAGARRARAHAGAVLPRHGARPGRDRRRPSAGTPTVASTTIKSGSEPPGTPAAPTAVMTLNTSTTICVPRSSDTPNTCARNRTVTPSYSAVPFMHIVEPRGSTKPAILGGIFSSSSATAMLVGSVALLELVENAVTMLARMRLQHTRGASPPSARTSSDRLTAP